MASYLGRFDLMPLATGLERELDVKLEVSRGHSIGNSKDRTLTMYVEVINLMTIAGTQTNALRASVKTQGGQNCAVR